MQREYNNSKREIKTIKKKKIQEEEKIIKKREEENSAQKGLFHQILSAQKGSI